VPPVGQHQRRGVPGALVDELAAQLCEGGVDARPVETRLSPPLSRPFADAVMPATARSSTTTAS